MNTIARGRALPVAEAAQNVVTRISRSPLVTLLPCFDPFVANTLFGFYVPGRAGRIKTE